MQLFNIQIFSNILNFSNIPNFFKDSEFFQILRIFATIPNFISSIQKNSNMLLKIIRIFFKFLRPFRILWKKIPKLSNFFQFLPHSEFRKFRFLLNFLTFFWIFLSFWEFLNSRQFPHLPAFQKIDMLEKTDFSKWKKYIYFWKNSKEPLKNKSENRLSTPLSRSKANLSNPSRKSNKENSNRKSVINLKESWRHHEM